MNIYDIAKEAGVSIASVSRVINSKPGVGAVTREKIERILARHNYTPSAVARGLTGSSMKTVGVLSIDVRDPYYAEVTFHMERQLREMGYSMILCNTGGDVESQLEYMNVLSRKRVDAMVLVGSDFRKSWLAGKIRDFAVSTPVIMINGQLDGENIYSLQYDDRQGMALCLSHLMERGHRRFLYIQSAETFGSRRKKEGAKSALAGTDNALCDFTRSGKGLDEGYHFMKNILEKDSLKWSAVVNEDDVTAAGVLKALLESGIRVPDEVAVTGFDNTDYSRISLPELTTVDSQMSNLGIHAVRLCLDILDGRLPSKNTVLSPRLIVRDST